MSLIAEHRRARNNKALIVFHEFKARYKRNDKTIYGFVEGKEDPSYYRGFIENNIPEDWLVELWPTGGQDFVLEIFSKLDWRKYKKKHILFFIDRDLSDLLDQNLPSSENIYITDDYSIENSIVSDSTCNRVLREICGLKDLKHNDYNAIIEVFNDQLERFKLELIPVMASILLWQKSNIRACYNDIQMRHLFSIKNGILEVKTRPNGNEDIIIYTHTQCNTGMCDISSLNVISDKFVSELLYCRFTRGKYLLWFLVEFCLSIVRDYRKVSFVKIATKPKMKVNLSHSNSIIQIAPRCRMPSSLKHFFDRTILQHITMHSNHGLA